MHAARRALSLSVAASGESGFVAASAGKKLLVACAGPITILPLVWFANGARRIRLSTLGIIQFLAPTGHFLLAVLAYGEPLNPTALLAFVFIWSALTIYTLDARASRRREAATPAPLAHASFSSRRTIE